MSNVDLTRLSGFCRKHGEIKPEEGYLCKDKAATAGYRLRCRICIHENRINLYYRNQPENIMKSAEWKKANRDRVNAQERQNRHKDIELTRDKEASRRKGLNLEQYYAMREIHDNKCAICRREERRKNRAGETSPRLCIDHNHDTGKIRGLLCHDCNTAIGKFQDKIELLQSAIDYLKKHE